jgi:hypothetical protein
MNKRLANPAIFQPTTSSPIRSWYSAWRGWNEARKLRMRKRAETVSGLNAWTLYDIGESDCRPPRSALPIWDNNPYRLLIEAVINRDPTEFDPRR